MRSIKTILIAIIILISCTISAQISVTTDGSIADGSAMLEVKSSSKGFLPPRMSGAQRDAIASPATGLIIFNTSDDVLQMYEGSEWVTLSLEPSSGSTDVTNPITGETWMDRNLGASRVATSSTDSEAYGDLYQWGRDTDGHEKRNSGTTTTLSSTNTPGHGNFIINDGGMDSYSDWRSPHNDDLWQGVNGINNPCPNGYRVPTSAEWNAERESWSSNNAAGAFGSVLRLPIAHYRNNLGGISYTESYGYYWSNSSYSNAWDTYSWGLIFDNSSAFMYYYSRIFGFSIRCIKDE